jgi:hypothetical protein
MPNVAPRGLFGNVAGAWKSAGGVSAILVDGGPWTPAKFVYAWCDATNKWEVIWGKDISVPLTPVATYLTDGTTSVKVDWTLPSPNVAYKWRVRRPDGTTVGDTASSLITTLTDLTPNTVAGTYKVSGIDQLGNESAQVAAPAVVISLQPATATATLSGTDDMVVAWTTGSQGQPDGWMVYNVTDAVWSSGQLAATARSFTATNLGRGKAYVFAVYPFISGWDQVDNRGVNRNTASTGVPADIPTSVALAALSSPLSTLRLTWAAPATGAITAYEVEHSTNNTTWTAHTDDVSPSDWGTTVAGYMRVRATSPGGSSAWVSKGPVTPINDTTPPTTPVITSFKPESSYGRMVVRFTTAASADINSYRVDYNTDGGAYVTGSWVACNPSTAIAVVLGKTFVATDIAGVRVYYKDDTGNISAADTATYTLVASPKVLSATDSATWRVDEWRTDGVSGSTGVMYGWTSTGHNVGCWFYGEALQDFVSTHTVTDVYVEYVRDGSSQGMSAASPVMTQVHQHATQPATAPVYTTTGEATGTAVARVTSPPGDGGYCYLNDSQIVLLAGSYKGICHYDGVANGNTYMRIYPAGTVGDGRTCGKCVISHLG